MTTLEKIRSHGVLLLVIVGIAMLAFILGDFINSGSTFFQKSRENVGSIEGANIHYLDYEAARAQLEEVLKIQQNGQIEINEDVQNYINTQVWQSLIMENVLTKEANTIGMTVTEEELSDIIIGSRPHQMLQQLPIAYDQNGNFSQATLIALLSQLEMEPQTAEQAQQIAQLKNYWLYWENAIRLTYLSEKYNALLGKLLGANKIDAKAAYDAKLATASAEYVVLPYYATADSTITVSEKELKKAYEARKAEFKQEPNRTIQYIAYDIVPSELDFEEAKKEITRLQAEFATTDDLAAFVNPNSDVTYNGYNYSETTIPATFKDFVFKKGAKAGDVSELIFADDTYSIARIVEVGYNLPDSINLRGIYLADAAQLDSLQAAWKKGKVEGAEEVGWVSEAEMPRELAEKAFHTAKNGFFTNAAGTGIIVYQVIDRSKATPKAKVAILAREVTASSRTYTNLYNAAKQFISVNNTEAAFMSAAQEQDLTVLPSAPLTAMSHKVAAIPSSRQIVRWAFENEAGAVSDVFECGNQFIVATLSSVKEGEYQPLSDVAPILRLELASEKKAEKIIAEVGTVTSLEDLAKKWDVTIQNADNVTMTNNRFGGSMEPAVVGATMALEAGAISAPIEGTTGVYVVKVTSKEMKEEAFNEITEMALLSAQYAYGTVNMLINNLIEGAEVEDNRAMFY